MKHSLIHLKGNDLISQHTTAIILRGTLIATILLIVLMLCFHITHPSTWFNNYAWAGTLVILYLIGGKIALRYRLVRTVNWMLIFFYQFLAFLTLLTWGLNAPAGLLTMSFAVILPSLLMGPRTIAPVVFMGILELLTVQTIHSSGIITPNLIVLAEPSSLWDVVMYSLILGVFALVSWVSGRQREKNLNQILKTEEKLKAQKDLLSTELEKESAALRLSQLSHFRELHKFALLGQSAAATLHELSNHICVLNLDIKDLSEKYQTQHTRALRNATQSIEHINKTVQQARSQLNTYDHDELFNAVPIINQFLRDIKPKFSKYNIELVRTSGLSSKKIVLKGNPLALKQIISVVLHNAIDACRDTVSSKVMVLLTDDENSLIISVKDNGIGLTEAQQKLLFKPIASTKPSGMGVGLYIAQHLASEHFAGSIKITPEMSGAHFNIILQKQQIPR